MARNRSPHAPYILAMVIISIALLPSCRRAPEEPTDARTRSPTPEDELTALELPQQNPEIGIS